MKIPEQNKKAGEGRGGGGLEQDEANQIYIFAYIFLQITKFHHDQLKTL